MRRTKQLVYEAAKHSGLFALSRRLTRGGLRILCHHGIAIRDEALFRPGLFIEPHAFERRLQYLRDQRFPVLPLDEAVARLDEGTLPENATVLTIDDGFYSTYRYALPALRRFGFPATLYVTTYYVRHPVPVFRLAAQYLFWKSERRQLPLDSLGLGLSGTGHFDGFDEHDPLIWRIVETAEQTLDEAGRQQLLHRLAGLLDVDLDALIASRALSLMTPNEIRACASAGMDIALHTHRHRLPTDRWSIEREIEENRAVLGSILGREPRHFCYPSGLWSPKHFNSLEALGIATATTCEPGLVGSDTPRLAMGRFLDGANIHPVEFEAELHGFSELLRKGRAFLKGPPAPRDDTVHHPAPATVPAI